jgi:hypothetical protein
MGLKFKQGATKSDRRQETRKFLNRQSPLICADFEGKQKTFANSPFAIRSPLPISARLANISPHLLCAFKGFNSRT